MIGAGGRRALVAGLVGLVLGLGGLAGQPAQARREGNGGPPGGGAGNGAGLYGCDRTFGRAPEGHLTKRTTPPAGQRVSPGDVIDVSVVWNPDDWSAARLHKVLDCVAVDGRLVPPLQAGESPTDNDGRFTRSYRVPDGVPEGAEICDQAMLSGRSPRDDYDRQISNMVCHTVSGNAGAQPPPCRDRCGEGRGCSDCYQKPPSDSGGGGKGCRDCYRKPPSDSGGGGKGCPDCYRKPPSDNGGGDKGCRDCYRKPPSGDRCGDKASCDGGKDGCGENRKPCEHDGGRDRNKGDCGCDDRDRDGSFLHRLLRHLFH